MSYFGTKHFSLEAAVGRAAGYATVNQFGRTTNADNGVFTDVWNGADTAIGAAAIQVPPTTARVHDIVSSSTNDTSAGTGLRTLRLYGLTGWGTAEVSEDITMNGTTNVQTANSYVYIHSMVGLTWGSGKINSGKITATAQTDATISAAINATANQSNMALYAVPSTQSICVETVQIQTLSSAATNITGILLARENADQSTSAFIAKEFWRFTEDRHVDRWYSVQKTFTGPCVVKLMVQSDVDNTDVTGAFDAYLVDN